ncbi:MAG: hypothetical protein AWT59_0940 [Candidatus Gallionella acididurans]|uniref:Filamentous haemagglutinin FhaB/tRNA nuclease CdiA-like TPS domain-containing protein n=1 Tax=Candidatus Gallionella acididurans TaxID=1796491 RepID=A0A139BVD6_9PROT|nr:MAG: hypothetical protein AWT59_0940 [Candidatus Gallionella acididurans]
MCTHKQVNDEQYQYGITQLRQSPLCPSIAWLTLIAYIGQPLIVTAQVIANQAAAPNKRPLIDTTANGIPLVQIATPNAAGVSQNQYTQFNVDPAGLILNNSQSTVLTRQAGYVAGNQNLANSAASVILNEVTSTSRSQLNGYIEVAGQQAQVIVANPNGITCNGCGFINTSRGVLTTGTPVIGTSGSLDALRVTGGDIQIGTAGLNAGNIGQIDLIARSVQVNGQLWAGNLNVITGANLVNYNTLGVQIIAGDANKPTVGIDVALLGGMYANKIRLVGTEAGVGVNSLGNLSAQAGDFTLDNQGQITLGGSTTASGNLGINSNTGIANTGTLSSQQTVQINSSGNILNRTGAIINSGNTVLNTAAGDITNNGYIYGNQINTRSNNLHNNYSIIGNAVNLSANNLYNTGGTAFIGATQAANLIVANAFANTGGAVINSLGDINIGSDVTVQGSGYLAGNAVSILNQSSTIEATGNLRLAANAINNQRTVVGLEYGPSWTGTPVVNTPVQGGPTVNSYTPTYANQQFTTTTTPAAQLLSGANMWLGGSTLNNNYSSIIAGGTLTTQMAINNYGPELSRSENRTGVSSVWVSTYHPQQGSCGFISVGCVNAYISWALVTTPYASAQSPTPISGLNYTNQNSSPSAYLAAKNNSTVTLPTSSLYTIHPQPGQPYLVVTDPRFTNYANFVSSDYMLSRLSLDPQQIQMRLGDGFYEQQQVTRQITADTGRIYVNGYADAQSQFIALMNSGVDAAKDFNLTVGVALTTAQINSLKHDIVWMVDRSVTLPNGTTEHVLAPQVYLSSVQEGGLKPSGALLAANVININSNSNSNSNSVNNSGTIRANTALSINASDITNQGGTISSGGNATLVAGNDILNLSGNISGANVSLTAGRDITNALTGQNVTRTIGNGVVNGTELNSTAGINATGSLGLNAGRDVSIVGATINAGGDATINAGRNLTVGVLTVTNSATANQYAAYDTGVTQHTSSIQTGGNLNLASGNDMLLTSAALNVGKDATLVAGGDLTLDASKNSTSSGYNTGSAIGRFKDETVLGSTLNAGGNVTLVATRLNTAATTQASDGGSSSGRTNGKGNITLQSTDITSKTGTLTVAADANVNIGTTAENHNAYTESHATGSGLFTHTTLDVHNESWRTDNIGSNLSANSISITSGKNIGVVGSTASAEHNINVAAMGDVNISAATNTYGSDSYRHETTTGLQFGSGGNPYSITDSGPDITTQARTDGTKQSYSRSSFTSNSGNLNIVSGGNLIASGTDLAANAGNLALTASGTVALLAGQDTLNQSSSTVIVTNPNFFTKQRHTITDTYASLDYQGSTVQGNSIKVSSGADTVLQAAQVTSGAGGINIDAGGDLKLLAAANTTSSTHTETLSTEGTAIKADGTADYAATRRMNNTGQGQTQTNRVTTLTSAGDITTHSGGDTLIEAGKLNAQGAINLSATGYAATTNADGSTNAGRDGKITFAAVKDSTYTSVADSNNSLAWQNSSGGGDYVETLKLANISAGKGFNVNANGGVVVDISNVPATPAPAPKRDANGKLIPVVPLTPEQQAAQQKADLNKLIQNLASQPGQAWIGQLANDPKVKVQWNQVQAAVQHWNYAHDGLTQEAVVVIAIVVAYFTAGAGSSLVGTTTAVEGGAAGATATTIGGTTLATSATTAAGVSVTTYTVAGAVINAGFTALASEASISFANNKGDIGKTLNDMGQSQNVRNVVAAMLTAGVGTSISSTNMTGVLAQTATGCATGEMVGIGCQQGATNAAVISGAALAYRTMVGYSADLRPGDNRPGSDTGDATYKYIDDPKSPNFGQQKLADQGMNVAGFNKLGSIGSQGGVISKVLNQVPFINATAGLHDYIFNANLLTQSTFNNIWTMGATALLTIPASLNDPSLSWLFINGMPYRLNSSPKPPLPLGIISVPSTTPQSAFNVNVQGRMP